MNFELTREKAKIIGEFLTAVNNNVFCSQDRPEKYSHLFLALGEGRQIKGLNSNTDGIKTIRFCHPPSYYLILPKTRPVTIRDVRVGDFVTWPCPKENDTYKILVLECVEHGFKAVIIEHSAWPELLGNFRFYDFNVGPGYRIFRKGVEIKEVEC